MKVTRNTPDQLILSDTPWLIGIMLVFFILAFVGPGLAIVSTGVWAGLIFVVFGGGMGVAAFCVFVRRVQVIFDRSADKIILRRQSVFGYTAVEHRLSDLSHAVTETTTSRRDGRTRTLHRPVLVLDDGMSAGHHPIVASYTSGAGAQRLTDAVNAWLPATPQDSGPLDSGPLDSDAQSA
ncbi:hypothetical protein K3727_20295 [Rhodobacteraceae bacterium M382]|nr:hypothetical protein K3727_20295 [Rhodobacteraceae bacterium M382]